MRELWQAVESVLTKYSLVTAFAVVGIIVWLSYTASQRLTRGLMHGSAIAILIGLLLAYAGGVASFADVLRVEAASGGNVDVTVGSALDLFGGGGVRYHDLVTWNNR